MDYAIPDGWRLPNHYDWRLCQCGFIWADTQAIPADFDEFYRKHYNPHNDQYDLNRIHQLGAFIFQHILPSSRIVDFAGGEGLLKKYLKSMAFPHVSEVNLDDQMVECDVVILSQVIEHLYDLRGTLDTINAYLTNKGIIIVETPAADQYAMKDNPPLLDYYPTHVNHFTPQTLSRLASDYGWMLAFPPMYYHYRPTNAPMMRMVFLKGGHLETFGAVKQKLTDIEPIGINERVVVYGLGDLALHQIAKSGLRIAYFVDEAPIYEGARINGIPVHNKLKDDGYPVLVISNRHRTEILAKLKGRRVITL